MRGQRLNCGGTTPLISFIDILTEVGSIGTWGCYEAVEHLPVALNISFHRTLLGHGEAAPTTTAGKLPRFDHKLCDLFIFSGVIFICFVASAAFLFHKAVPLRWIPLLSFVFPGVIQTQAERK